MSTNENFKKIDGKLDELKQGQQQVATDSKKNEEFFEEVVSRVGERAKEYAEQVKSRNIPVDLNISKYSISFMLKFKDGGHHGVILGHALRSQSSRIEITGSFTNDDGKKYTSTSGVSYDSENWNDDIFTSAIEKCIEDFVFYAPRHGGL
jgi:hypothetical protein